MAEENTQIRRAGFPGSWAVYSIFALSGASALVYQQIWARWLDLVFGNTTLSISIVLASFMAGLALGSWGTGRFLHHMRNPLRFYALIELGIGILAVCFPFMTSLADTLFSAILSPESATLSDICVKSALSSAVLLAPTTLMGATFPLLADYFHRSSEGRRTVKAGMLYAVNTFGGVVGMVTASFFLIELFGVRATNYAAAGLNLAAAALAFIFSKSTCPFPRQELPFADRDSIDGQGKAALVLISAGGFLALSSEVLWTRIVETIIGNSTYAFASLVAVYLLGIAMGSFIMSFLAKGLKHPLLWLSAMLLGMGLWTIAAIALFERVGKSLAVYTFKYVPLAEIFEHYLIVVGELLPLAVFSGACFPLAIRIIDPRSAEVKGSLIALVYTANTIGALAGALAAGFVIAPYWDYTTSIYLLAALYCLAASVPLFVMPAVPRRIPAVVGAISLAGFVFSFLSAGHEDYSLHHFSERNPNYRVAYHKPGLQGVTTVLKHLITHRGDRLLVNGMGMTTKVTDTKLMAHLPMLLHPDPENTLIICLGMGTTYRSAVSYGRQVTAVELSREVVEAFDYFYDDASFVKAYPRGTIIVNDGRHFLKTTRNSYDVITIDPPPPIDAAGVNHLHSTEFLELARGHLKKGGIMALWVPLPGSGAGIDDWETHDMVIRTFAQVFRYTFVHRGLNELGVQLVGSMEPIVISQENMKKALSDTAVSGDVNEWEKVSIDFLANGWMKLPKEYYREPVITDERPYLEFYLLRTLRGEGMKSHPENTLFR